MCDVHISCSLQCWYPCFKRDCAGMPRIFISIAANTCYMRKDRVPMNLDREPHDEPFITGADYIRSRQDNAQLPDSQGVERGMDAYDTRRTSEPDTSARDRHQNTGRSRSAQGQVPRRNTRQTRQPARDHASSEEDTANPRSQSYPQPQSRTDNDQGTEDREDAAVLHLVRKLREKGVSESYIHENMAEIRRRARRELLDQE